MVLERIIYHLHAQLESNPELVHAIQQDPGFIDVMQRMIGYDFYFYVDDPRLADDPVHAGDHVHARLYDLYLAIDILGELSDVPALRESALAALRAVLSEHQRLSPGFLWAAKRLEIGADCKILDICREALEEEILARTVPNTYRFDEGAIVFQTALTLDEVLPLYQGAKAVQAQFHRLVEADDPAGDDLDVLSARIYGTFRDFRVAESYLSQSPWGGDIWGVGGWYAQSRTALSVQAGFGRGDERVRSDLEHTFRHEYVHYLADRFGLLGHEPWFNEGLAEFLTGSTPAEGLLLLRNRFPFLMGDRAVFPYMYIADLVVSQYDHSFGGNQFYQQGQLFFHFMHQERRTELLELLDLAHSVSGDARSYADLIERWKQDPGMNAEYHAFMDEQAENWLQLSDFASTEFVARDLLAIDSVDEIESALEQVDDDLQLRCRHVSSLASPRFRCRGRLAADPGFAGDRGQLNEHLNARLDAFLKRARQEEAINNFQDMTCYFVDVTGAPPVADLSCDLPSGLPAANVDLAIAFDERLRPALSPGPEAGDTRDLGFWMELVDPLETSGLAASDFWISWSSSLPVQVLRAAAGDKECEIVQADEHHLTGRAACGALHYEAGLQVVLLEVVPREPGDLRFSVEVSTDAYEVEPGNNVDTVELTVRQSTRPHSMGILGEDSRKQAAGFELERPLLVRVLNYSGRPIEGAPVSFSMMAGEQILSVATDTTDDRGLAAASMTLPREPGTYTVAATVAGLDPVTFTVIAEVTPDFDADGQVGFSDFFLLAEALGGSDPRFDLDGDGTVGYGDFFLLAERFTPPARAKLLALARERIGLPDAPGLQPNAPNPFNSQTVISWFLLRPGPVRLEVFALTGQRVAVLREGPQKAGLHRLRWDGRDDRGRPLASGVYLCRLATEDRVQTRKLTLLR